MKSIFIDGQSGTTGQKIHTLVQHLTGVNIIIPDDPKNVVERQKCINQSDLTILCLPDDEAKKAVTFIHPDNQHTKILDCSSAFRTASGWVYGFPELSIDHSFEIAAARFVSNPGCYATGAVAALAPLMTAPQTYYYRGETYGLIQQSQFLPTIIGLSGYSGGGKNMIKEFEDNQSPPIFTAYSLGRNHKHEKEIEVQTGLKQCSLQPAVLPIFKGMVVIVPIDRSQLLYRLDASAVSTILANHYGTVSGSKVSVLPHENGNARVDTSELPFHTGKDDTLDEHVYLRVHGNDQDSKITIVSMLDNLGKGAATQALQNIRLMLNLP